MQEFKKELKKELGIYFNKVDSIDSEYSKYTGSKGIETYSQELVRKKKIELEAKKEVNVNVTK